MKTLHFQTSKVKGLIVDLQESYDQIEYLDQVEIRQADMYDESLSRLVLNPFEMYETSTDVLPPGNWQILNFLSLLTDEQKEMICESKMIKESFNDFQTKVFVNYNCREQIISKYFGTVSESFASLIESIGLITENKYKIPNEEDFKLKGRNEAEFKMIDEDRSGLKPTWQSCLDANYVSALKRYEEAESKVFKNPLILIENLHTSK